MTKVAVISTNDRIYGVNKSFELLKINPVKGKNVLLKPNFNTADPPPASTDMVTLKQIIIKLKELGAKSITVAERSGPANTEDVFIKKNIYELAKQLQFSVVNLSSLPKNEFVLKQPKGSHWKNGFLFPKIYANAESIVETCCLKTHMYGGHFTLSLKNAVGLVPKVGFEYMDELHSSTNQRKMIAEINSVYKPSLIIMDGIQAFIDGGPMRGTLKEANVFVAGTDKIAIDATGIALLRILGTTPEVSKEPIFKLEQIARAVELKLGINSPGEINYITDSKASEKLVTQIRTKLNE